MTKTFKTLPALYSIGFKKTYLLCLFVVLMILDQGGASAEERNVRLMSPVERIFVGGYLGAHFDFLTTLSLHAHTGYLLTNRLSAGISSNFQYSAIWGQRELATHVYGGGAFLRFKVISDFFVQTEFERLQLRIRQSSNSPDRFAKSSEDNYFIGLGYAAPVSRRVNLNLVFLYNIQQNSKVYFNNPFFRIGVDVYPF
jgi:hypothetical protein